MDSLFGVFFVFEVICTGFYRSCRLKAAIHTSSAGGGLFWGQTSELESFSLERQAPSRDT
ncbi:MAG: hypothetical protein CMJ53_00960 [Planctomycetaceae bacterium]|nr:hypothetical protein [Planctomycetaceae bacterium]